MAYDFRRSADVGIASSALAWVCWYIMTVPPVTEDDADYVAPVSLGLAYPRLVRGAVARIAEAWEKSHTFVCKVRDGELALTDDRIRKLPQSQRDHLFEVMSANAQLTLF